MLERNSSRAVILNRNHEVLLYKFIQDEIQGDVAWWVFPGGGLEGTESFEEALIREIQEEIGIAINAPMKWIWQRNILLNGKQGALLSHERFYLCQLDIETICLDHFTDHEKKTFQQYKWFSLDELKSFSEHISVSQAYELIEAIIQKKKIAYPITIEE